MNLEREGGWYKDLHGIVGFFFFYSFYYITCIHIYVYVMFIYIYIYIYMYVYIYIYIYHNDFMTVLTHRFGRRRCVFETV